MIAMILAFLRDESGATLVEYGLIIALISLTAIVALTLIGTNVQNTFTAISNALTSFTNGVPPP